MFVWERKAWFSPFSLYWPEKYVTLSGQKATPTQGNRHSRFPLEKEVFYETTDRTAADLCPFAAALTACAQHGADSTSSSAAPSPLSQDALAQPTYPKLTSYPNEKDYVKANGDFDSDGFQAAYDAWQADQQKQQNQPKDYQDGLNQFCANHLSAFFQGEQKGNQGFAPP